MHSCTSCVEEFPTPEALRVHKKDYHMSKVNCKMWGVDSDACNKYSVTIRRGQDKHFRCPGCNLRFSKWTEAYNHCSRATGLNHRQAVERFINQNSGPEGASTSRITLPHSQPTQNNNEHLVHGNFQASQKATEPQDVNDLHIEIVNRGSQLVHVNTEPPPTQGSSNIPGGPSGIIVDELSGIMTEDLSGLDLVEFFSYTPSPPGPTDESINLPVEHNSLRSEVEPVDVLRHQLPMSAHPHVQTQSAGAANTSEYSSLPIPYGSDDIVTSAELNLLNLVLYRPLKLAICVMCGIGVQQKSISRHRQGEPHNVPRLVSQPLIERITHLDIYDSDTLVEPPDLLPAVPGIPIFIHGYKCPFPGCNHCRRSRSKMSDHIRTVHSSTIRTNEPIVCPVQSLFESNTTNYPVVVSAQANICSNLQQVDLIAVVSTIYNNVISGNLSNNLDLDAAHLSPFLAKFKWHTYVADMSPLDLKAWVSSPGENEPQLLGLGDAIVEYFEKIALHMLGDDRWTTVLRWINTAKGDLNNKPFRLPMRKQTTKRYTRAHTRLLAFLLRIRLGKVTGYSLPQAGLISGAADNLLSCLTLRNQKEIQQAVHQLTMSILRERRMAPTSDSSSPVTLFLIYQNTRASGMIKLPGEIAGSISEFKWPMRAAAFWDIIKQVSQLCEADGEDQSFNLTVDNDDHPIMRIIKPVHKLLQENEFTTFAYVLELSHFVDHQAKHAVQMPRMIWQDDVGQEFALDGRPMSLSAFRNMYAKLISDTSALLHSEVLLGLELPNLHQAVIYDDLSNNTPGYSFFTDHRNNFHRHCKFLISAMLDASTSRNRFAFQAHSNPSGIMWNVQEIRKWYKIVQKVQGNMFAMLHFGSGQPARGTELTLLAWINSLIHPRNVYWFKGHLNIISIYNKTQTNTDMQRLISRAMEPQARELFIKWGTFVVPTLVILAASLQAPSTEGASRFNLLMFCSLNSEWDSDDFSSILSSITGRSVADGGLGYPMGLADTRHLLIGMMRKHFREFSDRYGLAEELLSEQSGHNDDTALRYALDFASIRNVPEERLHHFCTLSEMHHRLISTSPLSQEPSLASSATYLPASSHGVTQQMQESTLDLRKLSEDIATHLAPALALKLAPAMQSNLAAGFAAITPIAQVTSSSALPGLSTSLSLESELDVVDVNKVKISVERYRELRVLMGPNAVFRSRAQAAATELCALRQSDMLIVLGTGAGKSLIFMAAAVSIAECQTKSLVTVIVVPLNALLHDLQRRCTEKQITAFVYHPGISQPTTNTRCLLVTVDLAASEEFLSYLFSMNSQQRLARIVLDEIHFFWTSSHYRPLFNFMPRLRQLPVPLILLSATCPPDATLGLLQNFRFIPSVTKVIRTSTVRPNIVYSKFALIRKSAMADRCPTSFVDNSGVRTTVQDYIRNFTEEITERDRILIFCLTCKDTEELACSLMCGFYHSKETEQNRQNVLREWSTGAGSRILVSTGSLGAGVDCASVRMVVHYKAPRNLLDYAQESGRAGRDAGKAYSVVFWDPEDRGKHVDRNQNPIGVAEVQDWLFKDQCLRLIPGRFFDGEEKTCYDLANSQLCDFCAKPLRTLDLVSQNAQQNRLQQVQAALAPQSLPTVQQPGPIKRKRGESKCCTPGQSDATSLTAYSKEHTSANSITLEITSERARRFDNDQIIARASASSLGSTDMKVLLIEIRDNIGKQTFCTPCWLHGSDTNHQSTSCNHYALNWDLARSNFKSWKSHLDLPTHHCFSCGLPQKWNIHDNHSKDNPCIHGDFLRRLAYALWESRSTTDLMATFSASVGMQFSEERQYACWLCEMDPSNGWINLLRPAIWVWNQRRDSPPSQKRTRYEQLDPSHDPGQSLMATGSGTSTCSAATKWGTEHHLSHEDIRFLDDIGFTGKRDVGLLTEEDWARTTMLTRRRIENAVSNK